MATVTLFAHDAKGNSVDITGHTYEEIAVGDASTVLRFDYDDMADVRKILDTVNTVRSGIVWDWDAETSKRARITHFTLEVLGTNHQRIVMEAWVTPWGRHCRVEPTAHHVTNV